MKESGKNLRNTQLIPEKNRSPLKYQPLGKLDWVPVFEYIGIDDGADSRDCNYTENVDQSSYTSFARDQGL